MLRSGVWRHISCLDMDLLVLRMMYAGPKYVKVKVRYINRRGMLLHPDAETVTIQRADFLKWSCVG